MRDLAILLIYVAGLVYALRSPFAGLMVYMWISVMNAPVEAPRWTPKTGH